jgi:hypothetical protein
MPRRALRKPRRPSRGLTLEALEPRAMCALAPAHVVIPAGSVFGSTLRPDGSVEVYGADAQPFPNHLIIGDGAAVLDGGVEDSYRQRQWLIGDDGRLISKTDLEGPLAVSHRSIYAVSPDGSWFVGMKSATGAGEQGIIVVWRRGTNDLIPVGVSAEQTGGPMVRGISNDGDVIYMAYVGDDLRGFAWDRTDGLLPLESVYAMEGNASPDAAKFSVTAISADGRTIVGSSGGGIGVRQMPTVWRDGVPTALPAVSQSGEITDTSATSVSDDGRVIGGYVHLNTPNLSTTQAAVWVDGNLTLLQHSPNVPAFGPAFVVGGIGGDPTAWAALGTHWIARSDGVARYLHSYVQEEFGLSHNVNSRPVELLASHDALYVVTTESPSTVCAGFNCYTNGKVAAHVLVLPNDFSRGEGEALDLSGDGLVTPMDALIVIDALNASPGGSLLDRPELRLATPKIDVNGDGELTAGDALRVIDFLNARPRPETGSNESGGEGESAVGESGEDLMALAADELCRELATKRRK